MSADLYQRPSREAIAASIGGAQPPGTANGDDGLDGIVTRKRPDPLAVFAMHLQGRMRALGWGTADLQEKSGLSAHVTSRALNGTGCDLGIAGQLAALVGGDLRVMLGPYVCSTCDGNPPAGFGCLECGTEGERR